MSGIALEFHDVSVAYRGKPVLWDIDACIPAGSLCAIVGPNGAGKSTLLRAITGEWPSEGGVHFAGRLRKQWPREALARRLAVMTQQPQLNFAFTVRQVVELGRLPHRGAGARVDRQVVDTVLDALALQGFAERSYLQLSGGERQRVQFARVAAQIWAPEAPALLLLDEPTSALDLAQQQSVLALAERMRAGGTAVVAVLHDLNLAARHADRIALLKGGRLLAALPPLQALQAPLLREVFGVEADTLTDPRDGRPVVVVHRQSLVRAGHPGCQS
jgi:iron complex transport system ATP-binding protein